MRTDLRDMTFLIPVRVDSMVRVENLLMSVHSLLKNFATNILVLEADGYRNGIIPRVIGRKVEYLFVEDKDPVFYRTKYLNRMTSRSNTPYIGIWDADVIVPKEQVIDSVEKLRQGHEIAYPYDGHFYDTSFVLREMYFRDRSMRFLLRNKDKMGLIYGDKMKGGAMLANKKKYIEAGMENEKFYGWGPEDFERSERWKIWEYKVHQSEGPLFHLTHSRGNNSTFRSMEQVISANKELSLIHFSSYEELQDGI